MGYSTTEIKKIKKHAMSLLTEKGQKEVEEYVTKLWNDNKLSREHLQAIACELLLKE
jgi:hypothetical protein